MTWWPKLILWCKERWELIAGFVIGILTIIVAIKPRGSRDVIDAKNRSQKKINDANNKALDDLGTSLDENIKTFISKDKEIKKELEDKISSLDDEKKRRVKQLIESGSPEEDIATALREILK